MRTTVANAIYSILTALNAHANSTDSTCARRVINMIHDINNELYHGNVNPLMDINDNMDDNPNTANNLVHLHIKIKDKFVDHESLSVDVGCYKGRYQISTCQQANMIESEIPGALQWFRSVYEMSENEWMDIRITYL